MNAIHRAVTRLHGSLHYLAWLVLAVVVSMMLSFCVVHHYAGRIMAKEGPSPAAIAEVEELRSFSTEAVHLLAEYLDRANRELAPPSEVFILWAKQQYLPRVNDLRRKLLASKHEGPAMSSLLSALDRVAAMATSPAQPELRRMASTDLLDAVAQVDEQAKRLGLLDTAAGTRGLSLIRKQQKG